MNISDKLKGCFFGSICGDALGAPLEGLIRDSRPKITEILHNGLWTDDTSMMLCMVESMTRCKQFDPTDMKNTFIQWYKKGHNSSTSYCFGIGNTTIVAFDEYIKNGNLVATTTQERCCGNGSLMRINAIPLFTWNNLKSTEEIAQASSLLTHAHPLCLEACSIWAEAIALALQGKSKEKIIESFPEKYRSCIGKTRDEIHSSGYVVHTLEAALWSFANTTSFEEGCILVVNLGDDADTTGAVYGGLAGAFYGYNAIPSRWISSLRKLDMLNDFIVKFKEGFM